MQFKVSCPDKFLQILAYCRQSPSVLCMNEIITLPIEHIWAIIEVPLTIVRLGSNYQLHIEIDANALIFKKDKQGE